MAKEADFQKRLRAAMQLGLRSSQRNSLVAQQVLHEDLDLCEDVRSAEYRLTNIQRDRLIAHGRQDAANALINAAECLEAIKSLRRTLLYAIAVAASAAALLVFNVLARVWL